MPANFNNELLKRLAKDANEMNKETMKEIEVMRDVVANCISELEPFAIPETNKQVHEYVKLYRNIGEIYDEAAKDCEYIEEGLMLELNGNLTPERAGEISAYLKLQRGAEYLPYTIEDIKKMHADFTDEIIHKRVVSKQMDSLGKKFKRKVFRVKEAVC